MDRLHCGAFIRSQTKRGGVALQRSIERDPTKEINTLRKVKLVMKGGTLYKRP